MASFTKELIWRIALTVLFGLLLLLFSISIPTFTNLVEEVVVPCRHGGEYNAEIEACLCVGPWTGRFCETCACENGAVCSAQDSGTRETFPNSLWSCRCPSNSKFHGRLCERCNAENEQEDCSGNCLAGWSGPYCERMCLPGVTFGEVTADDAHEECFRAHIDGGECEVCSSHGVCDTQKMCECDDPWWFDSRDKLSKCARTCTRNENNLPCSGHGECTLRESSVVGCVCDSGYEIKSDCSLPCPGVEEEGVEKSCAGHGTCRENDSGDAVCDCRENFVGDSCSHRCPDSGEGICSGHGECSFEPSLFSATCDCDEGYVGPSCNCNVQSTCSGHGTCQEDDGSCLCDTNFAGEFCGRCTRGMYGTQCDVSCDFARDTIQNPVTASSVGCNGRGRCIVVHLGTDQETVTCGCDDGFSGPHCEECLPQFYPLVSVSAMEGYTFSGEVCSQYVSEETCNYFGEPNPLFGLQGEEICTCQKPNTDGGLLSLCLHCRDGYYPDDPSREDSCSRGCVESSESDGALSCEQGSVTCVTCYNGGTCSPQGFCKCTEGFTGDDCRISCGESGSECSGHGTCTTNALQKLLEHEIEDGASSICRCDPQSQFTEDDKMEMFLRGERVEELNPPSYYGADCAHSCPAPGWRDSEVCNGPSEGHCEPIPVFDDVGVPILGCVRDADCGSWDASTRRLLFDGEPADPNTHPGRAMLSNQLSLEDRFSARHGPFCHKSALPTTLHRINMRCEERKPNLENNQLCLHSTQELCQADSSNSCVWRDGFCEVLTRCRTHQTAQECHTDGTECVWKDMCMAAMREFDTWSYCLELMREDRPEPLRRKACQTEACTSAVKNVSWGQRCADYNDRLPEQFRECVGTASEADPLCSAPQPKTEGCGSDAFAGAPNTLNSKEAARFCWERGGGNGSLAFPFEFQPLLTSSLALTQLQEAFHSSFIDFGNEHPCAHFTENPCDAVPPLIELDAVPLWVCESGLSTSIVADERCEQVNSVRELSPFGLLCPENAEVTVLHADWKEAVLQSHTSGCPLVYRSDLHKQGVSHSYSDVQEVCHALSGLDNPSVCAKVCGTDACVHLGDTKVRCTATSAVLADDDGVCDKCNGLGTCKKGQGFFDYTCESLSVEDECADADVFSQCENVLKVARVGTVSGEKRLDEDGSKERLAEIEFYFNIANDKRGRVDVVDDSGTEEKVLASLLVNYGGLGVDLNVRDDSREACLEGEADTCHADDLVDGDVWYRVNLEMDWEENTVVVRFGNLGINRTATFSFVETGGTLLETDGVSALKVEGDIEIRNMYAFRTVQATEDGCVSAERCRALARATQNMPIPGADGEPRVLPFCASLERVANTSCTGLKRDVAYTLPWDAFCAYDSAVVALGEPCTSSLNTRADVQECETAHDIFETQSCAALAAPFNWTNELCAKEAVNVVPQTIHDACSDECVAGLDFPFDLSGFCERRDLGTFLDENDAVTPKIPRGCDASDADLQQAWRDAGWEEFCHKHADGTQGGECSVLRCECSSDFLTGPSCELNCALNPSDASPCGEDSFVGMCDFREQDRAKMDTYYLNKNVPAFANAQIDVQGVCECAYDEANPHEGCSMSCAYDTAEYACIGRHYGNNETGVGQVSTCLGSSGACKCLPVWTTFQETTKRDWMGRQQRIMDYVFAENYTSFNVRASQGRDSLMKNYFGAVDTDSAYDLFLSNPSQFQCGNRTCEQYDVARAQELFMTSPFYGATCSHVCNGVDLGDTMEPVPTCNANNMTMLRSHRSAKEACLDECKRDLACVVLAWSPATSLCRLFRTGNCDAEAETDTEQLWYKRHLNNGSNPLQLEPCSGRGRCGEVSGQCVCFVARYLTPTDPITGERVKISSQSMNDLENIPITSLDRSGYRGVSCEFVCPGFDEDEQDMQSVCNSHGVCLRDASCRCDAGWVGENCHLKCPANENGDVCSGHGSCVELTLEPAYSYTNTEEHYALTKAWSDLYHACPDNPAIENFVMPLPGINGTVTAEAFRGGPGCQPVNQTARQTGDPWKHPLEIKVTRLRDFRSLDYDYALTAALGTVDRCALACPDAGSCEDFGSYVTCTGISSCRLGTLVEGSCVNLPSSITKREGQFRYRRTHDQLFFIENYEVINASKSADEDEIAGTYEILRGYGCGDEVFYEETNVDRALCRQRCDNSTALFGTSCACFEHQEFEHVRRLQRCKLSSSSKIKAYEWSPIVETYGGRSGLVTKADAIASEDAEVRAVQPFQQDYATLETVYGCRSMNRPLPLAESVQQCANLCRSDVVGCEYFGFEPGTNECWAEETSTALCLEGLIPSTAGFHALVDTVSEFSEAPTAHVSTEDRSSRVYSDPATSLDQRSRGTENGVYIGAAQPNYKVKVATCRCSKNSVFGHWAGGSCHTCDVYWGTSSCTQRCPGGANPCYGNGECIWGSVDGEGSSFYDGICMCGSLGGLVTPTSTRLTDKEVYTVQHFDLHVVITANTGRMDDWNDPDISFNFKDNTCRECEDMYGGLNCFAQSKYCLNKGEPIFSVSDTTSVPCSCRGSMFGDPFQSCCPFGFALQSLVVDSDMARYTTSERDAIIDRQYGYVDPSVGALGRLPSMAQQPSEARYPSQSWCSPCPGIEFQPEFWNSPRAGRACGAAGTCQDLGIRSMLLASRPPLHFPVTCGELGPNWLAGVRHTWRKNGGFLCDNAQSADTIDISGTYAEFLQRCKDTCPSELDSGCSGIQISSQGMPRKCARCMGDVTMSSGAGSDTYIKERINGVCVHDDPQSVAISECTLFNVLYPGYTTCWWVPIDDEVSGVAGSFGPRCQVKEVVSGVETWVVPPEENRLADCGQNSPKERRPDSSLDFEQWTSAKAVAFDYTTMNAYPVDFEGGLGVMRPSNPCVATRGEGYQVVRDPDTFELTCDNPYLETSASCSLFDWSVHIGKALPTESLHEVHRHADTPHVAYLNGNLVRFAAKMDYYISYDSNGCGDGYTISSREECAEAAGLFYHMGDTTYTSYPTHTDAHTGCTWNYEANEFKFCGQDINCQNPHGVECSYIRPCLCRSFKFELTTAQCGQGTILDEDVCLRAIKDRYPDRTVEMSTEDHENDHEVKNGCTFVQEEGNVESLIGRVKQSFDHAHAYESLCMVYSDTGVRGVVLDFPNRDVAVVSLLTDGTIKSQIGSRRKYMGSALSTISNGWDGMGTSAAFNAQRFWMFSDTVVVGKKFSGISQEQFELAARNTDLSNIQLGASCNDIPLSSRLTEEECQQVATTAGASFSTMWSTEAAHGCLKKNDGSYVFNTMKFPNRRDCSPYSDKQCACSDPNYVLVNSPYECAKKCSEDSTCASWQAERVPHLTWTDTSNTLITCQHPASGNTQFYMDGVQCKDVATMLDMSFTTVDDDNKPFGCVQDSAGIFFNTNPYIQNCRYDLNQWSCMCAFPKQWKCAFFGDSVFTGITSTVTQPAYRTADPIVKIAAGRRDDFVGPATVDKVKAKCENTGGQTSFTQCRDFAVERACDCVSWMGVNGCDHSLKDGGKYPFKSWCYVRDPNLCPSSKPLLGLGWRYCSEEQKVTTDPCACKELVGEQGCNKREGGPSGTSWCWVADPNNCPEPDGGWVAELALTGDKGRTCTQPSVYIKDDYSLTLEQNHCRDYYSGDDNTNFLQFAHSAENGGSNEAERRENCADACRGRMIDGETITGFFVDEHGASTYWNGRCFCSMLSTSDCETQTNTPNNYNQYSFNMDEHRLGTWKGEITNSDAPPGCFSVDAVYMYNSYWNNDNFDTIPETFTFEQPGAWGAWNELSWLKLICGNTGAHSATSGIIRQNGDLDTDEPRGFSIHDNDPENCARLCAMTPGCDRATLKHKGSTCYLHDNTDTNLQPSLAECGDDPAHCYTFELKADRCGVCEALGFTEPSLSRTSKFMRNKDLTAREEPVLMCGARDSPCGVLEESSTLYIGSVVTNSLARCTAERKINDPISIQIYMDSQYELLDDDFPYRMLSSLDSRDACASACREDPICKAFEYAGATSKACDLFDTVPQRVVMEGQTHHSTGEVQRTYGPHFVLADDGVERYGCECEEDFDGYDCMCQSSSSNLFYRVGQTDAYGCSSRGVCSNTGYKCVCDLGYSWQLVDSSDGKGFTCVACPAGRQKGTTESACASCRPGFYSDEEGLVECKSCPLGKETVDFESKSVDSCQSCMPGRYSNSGGRCKGCADDYYQEMSGQSECRACPSGWVSSYSLDGTTNCILCPPGWGRWGDSILGSAYQNEYSAAELDLCRPCPAGTAPHSVTDECDTCDLGTYARSITEEEVLVFTACDSCQAGRYMDSKTELEADFIVDSIPEYGYEFPAGAAGSLSTAVITMKDGRCDDVGMRFLNSFARKTAENYATVVGGGTCEFPLRTADMCQQAATLLQHEFSFTVNYNGAEITKASEPSGCMVDYNNDYDELRFNGISESAMTCGMHDSSFNADCICHIPPVVLRDEGRCDTVIQDESTCREMVYEYLSKLNGKPVEIVTSNDDNENHKIYHEWKCIRAARRLNRYNNYFGVGNGPVFDENAYSANNDNNAYVSAIRKPFCAHYDGKAWANSQLDQPADVSSCPGWDCTQEMQYCSQGIGYCCMNTNSGLQWQAGACPEREGVYITSIAQMEGAFVPGYSQSKFKVEGPNRNGPAYPPGCFFEVSTSDSSVVDIIFNPTTDSTVPCSDTQRCVCPGCLAGNLDIQGKSYFASYIPPNEDENNADPEVDCKHQRFDTSALFTPGKDVAPAQCGAGEMVGGRANVEVTVPLPVGSAGEIGYNHASEAVIPFSGVDITSVVREPGDCGDVGFGGWSHPFSGDGAYGALTYTYDRMPFGKCCEEPGRSPLLRYDQCVEYAVSLLGAGSSPAVVSDSDKPPGCYFQYGGYWPWALNSGWTIKFNTGSSMTRLDLRETTFSNYIDGEFISVICKSINGGSRNRATYATTQVPVQMSLGSTFKIWSLDAGSEVSPSVVARPTINAGKCEACPLGFFSTASMPHCEMCSQNSYADEVGLAACKTCPAGKYAPYNHYERFSGVCDSMQANELLSIPDATREECFMHCDANTGCDGTGYNAYNSVKCKLYSGISWEICDNDGMYSDGSRVFRKKLVEGVDNYVYKCLTTDADGSCAGRVCAASPLIASNGLGQMVQTVFPPGTIIQTCLRACSDLDACTGVNNLGLFGGCELMAEPCAVGVPHPVFGDVAFFLEKRSLNDYFTQNHVGLWDDRRRLFTIDGFVRTTFRNSVDKCIPTGNRRLVAHDADHVNDGVLRPPQKPSECKNCRMEVCPKGTTAAGFECLNTTRT